MKRKLNDEELISRIKQGDQKALEALVKFYLPKTYKRVCNLVPESDAEDVTQDIFLALIHSIESFESRAAFSTWFYRVVMNKISDYYRMASRYENEGKLEDVKNLGADPWLKKEAEIDEAELKKILMDIPHIEREVILLRLSDKLSFGEIASQVGLTYEATRSRYRRALEMIKEKMKKA